MNPTSPQPSEREEGVLPEPALVIGTKLLPYEERFFHSGEDMAIALGYTEDLKRYWSESQVRELLASQKQNSGDGNE